MAEHRRRVPTTTLSCKENPRGSGGEVGEGDSVAEVVELADEVVAALVGVGPLGEPVATQILVVAVVGEQVPSSDRLRRRGG
jgi:hypothetical protein